jgi:ankyrin repeat protein
MPKSPTIYRLAADRQYDAIPSRVQSHPEDLNWHDRYGSLALHILCQARAVDEPLLAAVDAILRVAPEQVAWANVATWTPLHFAVEKRLAWGNDRNTTALILRLIKACPSTVSVRTHSGFKTKTPFHIACEADADYVVLKAMLTINPNLATEPYVKKDVYSVVENPLQLLWKNNKHSSSTNNNHNHNNDNQNSPNHNNSLRSQRHTKEKMALLLKAAHYGTVRTLPAGRTFRLLNAACSIRCPRDYFTLVLQEHRDQIDQPDEDGLLPLHYAVMNASPDSQAYTHFVVEALLEAYPQGASIADSAGRLPLHVAVSDALMTWHKGGVRELTFSCPNALRRRDPVSGLVPFLASASVANKSRLHLSTTFELLLAAPEMVQSGTKVITEDSSSLLSDRWTVVEDIP